jgi:hypothetical protein
MAKPLKNSASRRGPAGYFRFKGILHAPGFRGCHDNRSVPVEKYQWTKI